MARREDGSCCPFLGTAGTPRSLRVPKSCNGDGSHRCGVLGADSGKGATHYATRQCDGAAAMDGAADLPELLDPQSMPLRPSIRDPQKRLPPAKSRDGPRTLKWSPSTLAEDAGEGTADSSSEADGPAPAVHVVAPAVQSRSRSSRSSVQSDRSSLQSEPGFLRAGRRSSAMNHRRTLLPTQRLQQMVEGGCIPEEEEEKEQADGTADLMLVLPVGPQPGDDEPLAKPGPDSANPAMGSASWFIKQIINDDEVFTATPKREAVHDPGRAGIGRPSTLPQYFRPSVVVEYPLMKLCYTEALQEAETKGQLRERVVELLLRYLMSAKCCLQVRAFLGCDGQHLFLGICADEVVLRGHADALGYQVQLDANVARGFLRGTFRRDELHPAYVRYDLEEEHHFRSLHGHSPFRSYFDTFAEASGGSIFRGIDRMRIIDRVISRVFSLEDMLEHGFITARYSCHNMVQQRALGRSWATPRLFHSSTIPHNEICNYLGEAMTFRICFLSFLTRALLPVVAIALAANIVPGWLASKTLLSMLLCVVLALWGTLFTGLWLRKERYWIMVWGMDNVKKTEVTRSRFNGNWGVSTIDRYTIVKTAPWTSQLYRRALTCVVTCAFNLSLLGLVVLLFSYRQHLLKAGHTRGAQAVYYLNAFQMLVADTVWGYLAISLTDFDNYATDLEYTEQVIQRIFVTRFISSFASLFYIALVKHFMETCTDGHGCYDELAKQLRVLFGASMARSVLRAAFSYTWFRVSNQAKLVRAKERLRSSGHNVFGELCQQSTLEIQASMPDFTLSEDVEDSMDLIIELGFVLFFGPVAPEIMWLFCISNLIRIRAWGWKLVFAVRRPFPTSASGLGTLNKVVHLMSISAVWCNILLCLSLNLQYRSSKADVLSWLEQLVGSTTGPVTTGNEFNWKTVLAIFLILERTLFLARGLIDYCLRHSAGDLEIEEKRRDAMITAYYKLIVEDANVEESQGMTESSVEALVPVAGDTFGAPLPPKAWYPVGVERILKACREIKPEAETAVYPFTSKDPGFEYPWDEQDLDEDVEALLLATPTCCSKVNPL